MKAQLQGWSRVEGRFARSVARSDGAAPGLLSAIRSLPDRARVTQCEHRRVGRSAEAEACPYQRAMYCSTRIYTLHTTIFLPIIQTNSWTSTAQKVLIVNFIVVRKSAIHQRNEHFHSGSNQLLCFLLALNISGINKALQSNSGAHIILTLRCPLSAVNNVLADLPLLTSTLWLTAGALNTTLSVPDPYFSTEERHSRRSIFLLVNIPISRERRMQRKTSK